MKFCIYPKSDRGRQGDGVFRQGDGVFVFSGRGKESDRGTRFLSFAKTLSLCLIPLSEERQKLRPSV